MRHFNVDTTVMYLYCLLHIYMRYVTEAEAIVKIWAQEQLPLALNEQVFYIERLLR